MTLAPELRGLLEDVCKAARADAERAVRDAIARVKAGPESPLRRRLRAQEEQEAAHFAEHAAFTQWHLRLFARFLAENGLLREESGVAVTLDEVRELALEAGEDPWSLAARYAFAMLPGVFPQGDATVDLPLAPDERQALERRVEGLPTACFTADDALGWTYQFWQTARKEAVNRKGDKVEGDDLAAVTQLFTERYMVRFLLQNTLGAWWAARRPGSPLVRDWEYLKPSVEHDFSKWPDDPRALRVLDPCCGSGHFLTEAFAMLFAMRREAGDAPDVAARGVLRENLFGLELDDRCVQIAAFALTLSAWRAGLPRDETVLPQLACSGLAIHAPEEKWRAMAGGDEDLAEALARLHGRLVEADSIGSLLDPGVELGAEKTLFTEGLLPRLVRALKRETIDDPAAAAFGVRVDGVLRALSLLARGDFHLVATNPPFLLASKAIPALRDFVAERYPDGKKDLATAFVLRGFRFLREGGLLAMVTPQNWLFLGSDRKLREGLLKNRRWLAVARFGPGAFETIGGEVVQVANVILAKQSPSSDARFLGIDASAPRRASEKAALLAEAAP